MEAFYSVGLVMLCLCMGLSAGQEGACTKTGRCSCIYDDGLIVNLTDIAKTDGSAEWYNVSNSEGQLFSWNPCYNFNLTFNRNDSDCIDVAMCMLDTRGIPKELIYDLGSEETGVFSVDGNETLTLTYTADKGDFKRQTVITLQCMPTSVFDFLVAGEEKDIGNDTIVYELMFASKHACAYAPSIGPTSATLPPGPPTHEHVSSGLNAGEIFAILLFSMIGAYIMFGMAYQVFVNKATGKEVCPNHSFWCNLPEILKNSCRTKEDKVHTYDAI